MKERRPSGEPVLAEVGPPVILSLDVAGYFSVMRPRQRGAGRATASAAAGPGQQQTSALGSERGIDGAPGALVPRQE
jgi:hypothetical protein